MDFKYCYEKNGYKNDVEKLSNDWKAYLAGYLAAIEHLQNACYCFTDHKSIDSNELPTLSKIENDFFHTNADFLLCWIKRHYYEEVIGIMDHQWNEEKQCFEGLEWGTPAAPDDDDNDDID